MPEQETTDRWLREALSQAPLPSLSPGFDDRLAKRLQPPRRLTAKGRLVLTGYAVLATSLAIWVMRSLAIDWPLVAVACVAPVVTMAVLYGKRRGLA